MKNLFKAIFLATAITATTVFSSYAAADYVSPDILPPNPVDVEVDADVPEYYNKKINVMINGVDYYLRYRDDMPNHGYTRTRPITDGVYEVEVYSNEDINDDYTYEFEPKTLDTSKCQKVKIKVTPNENTFEEGDEPMEGDEPIEGYEGQDIGPLVVEPEVIDYSEGQPYGTFHVALESYEPAITSVIYSINSGTKIYDIELKRDYNFKADVKLPVGSYYERGVPKFELDERATWNDEIKCTWSHKYIPGFFGKYYDITEGGADFAIDLEITMVLKNDVFPFDSYMLFEPYMQESKRAEIESHAQAIQESLHGTVEETESVTETETESETIAELQPVEDASNDNWKIILAVVGVSILGFASVVVYKKRKG